jgi:hypothetical protein
MSSGVVTLDSRVKQEWITVGVDGQRRVTRARVAAWVRQSGQDLLVGHHFYPWLLFLSVFHEELDTWQSDFELYVRRYLELSESRRDWPNRRFPGSASIDSFGPDVLMGSIHVDVVRTTRIIYAVPAAVPPDPANPSADPLFERHEHYRRIERLLFVFGSTIGDRYCQGFNELAAVLYLAIVGGFWTGETYVSYMERIAPLDQAEALTYFAFDKLMKNLGLLKLYGLDDANFLTEYLASFEGIVAATLPETAEILRQNGITPLFYAIRWFTLLFAQEYDILTILWIWDEIFLHANDILEYLKHMALAHLEAASRNFKPGNYMETLRAVQHIKISDIRGIRAKATLNWHRAEGHADIEPFDEVAEPAPNRHVSRLPLLRS